MVKDIVAFVSHYPQLYEMAGRHGMEVWPFLFRGARKLDLEFLPDDAKPEELLTIKESGTLTHDQARALYKQLSSYFARHGVKKLSPAQKKNRAQAAAKKRWHSE